MSMVPSDPTTGPDVMERLGGNLGTGDPAIR